MSELDRLLFRRFANIINKEGGITLAQDLLEVGQDYGYFVSLFGVKRELPNRCEDHNTSFVSGHDVEVCFKELANKYGVLGLIGYVGFWKENITLYADITIHIEHRFLAVLVGKLFKQKAIYDCKGNSVINL